MKYTHFKQFDPYASFVLLEAEYQNMKKLTDQPVFGLQKDGRIIKLDFAFHAEYVVAISNSEHVLKQHMEALKNMASMVTARVQKVAKVKAKVNTMEEVIYE
jgi:hypothetical protein